IINGPELLSKFVGETEKNVRDLFADAEQDQRTQGDQSDLHIIIFDEIDAICKGNEDLILVHDALEFGDCRLSLAVSHCSPLTQYSDTQIWDFLECKLNEGASTNASMDTRETSESCHWFHLCMLHFTLSYHFSVLGPKFMKENGVKHVTFSTADGALEAAPTMGIAEAIVDLVSRGTTLRENNLKEIEGGVILQSQVVLVASRKSLTQRKGVLDITHEILERLKAHLRAIGQFTVTANMRGSSQEEVAERILSQTSLSGLQGPTISPIFCKRDGRVIADYYAIVICVPKKLLYKSVQQLRAVRHFFFLYSIYAINYNNRNYSFPSSHPSTHDTQRVRERPQSLGFSLIWGRE
ncbi:hypothetical protein HYC85_024783, partial [Camellia sinensis]